MRHVGVPLGLLCLIYGAWKIVEGDTSSGAYTAALGLMALLTWWATTRSERVRRWKGSNDAIRLELLAPFE